MTLGFGVGSGGARRNPGAEVMDWNLLSISDGLDGTGGRCWAACVEPVQFAGRIRYWNPDKASGLAVCDIPTEHVVAVGGLKQQRAHGRIGGIEYSSSVMPAGGGRLALSVSKAMMAATGLDVGDLADIEILSVDRT